MVDLELKSAIIKLKNVVMAAPSVAFCGWLLWVESSSLHISDWFWHVPWMFHQIGIVKEWQGTLYCWGSHSNAIALRGVLVLCSDEVGNFSQRTS